MLVIDEATQKIVDTIPTEVGLPTAMRQSFDGKQIYIGTEDHNGISVIDIASHKVLNHFVLNSGNRQLRINCLRRILRQVYLYRRDRSG